MSTTLTAVTNSMMGMAPQKPASFAQNKVNDTTPVTCNTSKSYVTHHVADGFMRIHRGGHVGYDDKFHDDACGDTTDTQDDEASAAGEV